MRGIINKKNFIVVFISIAFLFSNSVIAFSAESDDIQMILKELGQLKEKVSQVDALEQRVKELEKKVSIQEKTILLQRNVIERVVDTSPEMKKALLPPEQKVLVKNFVLNGVHLFSAKDFEIILSKYRNKDLGLSDLKKVADEITGFYRGKGYITSLAYAPAQEIANGSVEFRIIESRLGKITVEDGKYYSKETVERKITVEEGQILDYAKLEKDIKRINKQPDRVVKAVLVPGQEPSTSDVVLKFEEEESPIHWRIGYNNQGTENTGKDRFDLGFNNNNLFGVEDMLSINLRVGTDYKSVYSGSMDYNLPISRYDTRLGIYALHSRADIGKTFEILTPEGEANLWGIYLRHPLFDENLLEPNTINVASTVSIGFDSISTQNKILGQETSHDELRVVKAGISFDEKDTMGRTFVTSEVRVGLSDILGADGRYDESDSRLDTGTEFFKYVGSISRVTRLPLSSHLVTSMRGQYTNDYLSNSEQLSLGGASSIRGFPENEYLSDYGWSSTLELRTPAFLFPQGIKVPFDQKKTSLKEALQFVYFVDFGQGYLLRASVGEVDNRSLIGAGFGLRFDLADHFRGRLDWGFPISKEQPSDSSSSQVHFGFEYEF